MRIRRVNPHVSQFNQRQLRELPKRDSQVVEGAKEWLKEFVTDASAAKVLGATFSVGATAGAAIGTGIAKVIGASLLTGAIGGAVVGGAALVGAAVWYALRNVAIP